MLAFNITLVLVYPLLFGCKTVRQKLQKMLFWNGLIGLFMELYMELGLLSMYNLNKLEWKSGSTLYTASNVLAIVSMALVSALPLLMFCFYC